MQQKTCAFKITEAIYIMTSQPGLFSKEHHEVTLRSFDIAIKWILD